MLPKRHVERRRKATAERERKRRRKRERERKLQRELLTGRQGEMEEKGQGDNRGEEMEIKSLLPFPHKLARHRALK